MPITVRDGLGAPQVVETLPAKGQAPMAASLPVAIASDQTAVPVIQAGSTGADYSVNGAAVPMSGFVLLTTIPATPGRAHVEVQNQSAGAIQVVRDDGAGNNVTSVLLMGVGPGQQGGSCSYKAFKGRIRVYGASGAQVSAFQD